MSMSFVCLSARASSKRRCRPFFTGQLPGGAGCRPGSVAPRRAGPTTYAPPNARERPVVAVRRRVPDLPAILPRHRRGRRGRPRGHPPTTGLPAVAGSRRSVAVAGLPLPHARLRLRRLGLLRRRPRLRRSGCPRRLGGRRPTTTASGSSSTGCPTTPPTSTRGSWTAVRPARPTTATGTSGATPPPTAARPTTGSGRGATSRRGPSTRPPASTTCTASCPSSPTSTGPTPRSRRPCTTCSASGWTGASTASAWTSSTSSARTPTLPDDPEDLAGLSHVPLNDRPETHELLRGLRRVLDAYPGDRVSIGEVYLLDTARVAEYLGHDDELHLAFNFPPLLAPWDAGKWRRQLEIAAAEHDPRGAWPTWVLSNHDNRRHRTRYGSEARARAAAVLLLTLRGTPFLYAGEELGLEDGVIPPERVVDPGGPRRLPLAHPLGARAHPWLGHRGPVAPLAAGPRPPQRPLRDRRPGVDPPPVPSPAGRPPVLDRPPRRLAHPARRARPAESWPTPARPTATSG